MITITMIKPFLSFFSLCFLLFTTCLASHHSQFERLHKCQLNIINALEPDHRVESEAGLTETWNPNHPELKCAGVSLIRRTIDPYGLHIPSYSPSPQLIFIIQGKGVLGLSVPGCPDTFEEPRSSYSRYEFRKQQQQMDSHQKISRFNKGDVIAIPAGIPYWTYNHGDEPLVAISLLDTSNPANQLDSTPRVFYIGGNPEAEFPETQEEQQGHHQHKHSIPGGRRGGHHQQEDESEEQSDGNSVLSGFSSEFIAQALNTNEDIAKRIQSPRDKRSQIVRVEDGLDIISPEWQEEEDDEDEQSQRQREDDEDDERRPHRHQKEEEDEDEQSQRQREDDEDDERRPGHSRGQQKEEESEDIDEDDEEEKQYTRESRWKWKQRQAEKKRGSHGRREERKEEEICEERCDERRNGLEETICSAKIVENIARPSRADLYNPHAGRISTANSLTLPILRKLRLSAQYVVLYRNGIYPPHWNINANSLMYVTKGQGRVRVVNSKGNAVFNDNLRKGQLLVVPQNFVVAQQAGNEEGFEYVVFKTNDRASVSDVKQVIRATPAEVLENAFGLRPREVSELKQLNGNLGPLVQSQSSSQ